MTSLTRTKHLKHVFVEYIPDEPEPGALYVSIEYATTVHLCCCGCGLEVVAPLSPTDWRLVFDGESVSLEPSIGNWAFPCRSHYWVRRSQVVWAERWSQQQVETGREIDREAKRGHYEKLAESSGASASAGKAPWWSRFWRALTR